MKTTTYNPGMQIRNVEQLRSGPGAKYLEVLDVGEGPFLAIQWRRVLPKSLAKNHKLIAFGR